jgi:hypothetical protein
VRPFYWQTEQTEAERTKRKIYTVLKTLLENSGGGREAIGTEHPAASRLPITL